MPAIGLHITRTAGTSLHKAIGNVMERGRVYVCSSAIQRLRDNEQLILGPSAIRRLHLIFGHYVHESIVEAYAPSQVFLFTTLREPIERSLSNLRHINKLRAAINAPPIELMDYAASQSNTVCEELLRAFPSLRDESRPLRESALDVLDLFDFVATPQTQPQLAEEIARFLGVSVPAIGVENATRKDARAEDNRSALALLREKNAEDLAVFQAMQERARGLGIRLRKRATKSRERLVAAHPGAHEEKVQFWIKHLRRYYAAEMQELMKTDEAVALLEESRQQHEAFTAAYKALIDPPSA